MPLRMSWEEKMRNENKRDTYKILEQPSHLRDHVLDYGVPIAEKRQPTLLDLLLTPPNEIHLINRKARPIEETRKAGINIAL